MIKGGPKIVNDGLVLCLDPHDVKSYAGEPISNLVTDSAIDFTEISTYVDLSSTRVTDDESPSGYACEMYESSEANSAARSRFGLATNIPTSGTGFVSVWVKQTAGLADIRPYVYTGGGWYIMAPLDGGSQYLTDKYRPFGVGVTFSTSSGGPNPGFNMNRDGTSVANVDIVRWIKPQVTTLSYNVPFSNLTRPNQIDFISHGDVGSGTTFIDSSVNNLTLTSDNGTSHSGTGPFGGSAMSFVRASSQQITSPSTSLCDFGTDDFTIDFWFNMNSGTATNTRMHALNIGVGNTTNVSFDFNDSGYGIWVYWMSGGSNNIRQLSNFYNDGLWHHCAFVRDNGTCRLWVDGVYIGGSAYATQIGATQSLYIGSSSGGQYWDGHIDEVRIVKGTALWKGDSDIAPPTSRGKNAPLLDRTTNNNGTLVNGTNTGVSHYRDGQVIMPVANSYLDLDGTDDYIQIPQFDFTSTHSLEWWFNTDNLTEKESGGYAGHMLCWGNAPSERVYLKTDGSIAVYIHDSSTGAIFTTSNFSVTAGVWINIVVTFDWVSKSVKFYQNGVLKDTISFSSLGSWNYTGASNPYDYIDFGRNVNNNNIFFDGKVAGIKIYSKILTLTEVLNNYNATKGRFNL